MTMTVGELTEALFDLYPEGDASDWDACGLRVGDPSAEVTGVMVALDVSAAAIEAARERGANVLVTHHPVYLDPADRIVAGLDGPGLAFHAASTGVALVSMHTNLDRSPSVRGDMLGHLGAVYRGPLEGWSHGEDDRAPAFGQIGVFEDGIALSLAEVAERAARSWEVAPRVWGDPDRPVRTVATASGSASSLIPDAIAAQVDVLVAGEVKYHDALMASSAGIALILLGHDTSEEFLADHLFDAVANIVAVDTIRFDSGPSWWTMGGAR